jgi:hypothetical protein
MKWKNRTKGEKSPYSKMVVFDYDNTLYESVGTFEQDHDLNKFIKDNSFWNNLFTKALPLATSVNEFYKDGETLVVIQTARAERWWFPLLLFIKGIKYHYVIQRPRANYSHSANLKKSQMVDFLMRNPRYKNCFKVFVDDYKPNRDQLETVGFSVYNANYYNGKE